MTWGPWVALLGVNGPNLWISPSTQRTGLKKTSKFGHSHSTSPIPQIVDAAMMALKPGHNSHTKKQMKGLGLNRTRLPEDCPNSVSVPATIAALTLALAETILDMTTLDAHK
jgi:hypothetical protein